MTFNGWRSVATVIGRFWCVRYRREGIIEETNGESKVKNSLWRRRWGDSESASRGIEKAGHTVQQAEGRKAVEASLKTSAFDLVVLGPT